MTIHPARLVTVSILLAAAAFAGVRYDGASSSWSLRSGNVEYRLVLRREAVAFAYFGPLGGQAWTSHPAPTPRLEADIDGMVEGQTIQPADLVLLQHEERRGAKDVEELCLTFRHRRLPLEIKVVYSTWGDTGVLTRKVEARNTGAAPLRIESLASLAWRLPEGDYELTYLWGGWGQERQMATETLGPGRRSFRSALGRSTALYSPWFALRNNRLQVTYVAQLAWSGNWQMGFERLPAVGDFELNERELAVDLGPRFDFGGALRLAPGCSYSFPAVAFTAASADLDEATNAMHRYQRQYVIPHAPANSPPLVQFNTWNPFPGKMTIAEMKRAAALAGELGAEVFVLDAGWFASKSWDMELGDWEPDRGAFPNGLEELSRFVHERGMAFGLWTEIESVGKKSAMFRRHPDWCLSYNGKPIETSLRYHLDFARADVRAWARSVVDRLVRDYGLTWLKIDYNLSIGEQFDPPDAGRTGDILARHLEGFYTWLDELRTSHPELVIENCSSGALRSDLAMVGRTHTSWLSDFVKPLPSLQLGYGCTVEFAPEICNHWMVGDDSEGRVSLSSDAGWWDFLFRVPMNGQFGFSSRVLDWNTALKQRAMENIALYKRIRTVIDGADVYHLTPQPKRNNPSGWMAIEYVGQDRRRSVVMAYRLGHSASTTTLTPRGLDPSRHYRVSQDGRDLLVATGRELSAVGIPVNLGAEWRAAIIELEAQP